MHVGDRISKYTLFLKSSSTLRKTGSGTRLNKNRAGKESVLVALHMRAGICAAHFADNCAGNCAGICAANCAEVLPYDGNVRGVFVLMMTKT